MPEELLSSWWTFVSLWAVSCLSGWEISSNWWVGMNEMVASTVKALHLLQRRTIQFLCDGYVCRWRRGRSFSHPLGRLESVPVFVDQNSTFLGSSSIIMSSEWRNLWHSFKVSSSMIKCCYHLWHIRVPWGAPRWGIQWHDVITIWTQTGDLVVLYHQVIKVHISDGFMIPETAMLLTWSFP